MKTDYGEFDFTGRIYTQGSWRTEDSQGFTFPETKTWDFIQHRNLLQVEIKDKLRDELSVFVSGRFVYDGLADYGASQFEKYADSDIEYDLRECYADIKLESVFLRLGKQNLSWGEADLFRLLDGINPLDNTFGIFFEELDERRLPLEMARADVDLGSWGFADNLTAEGFIAVGDRQAPVADYGTPYAAPTAPLPLPLKVGSPDLTDFRGGVRVIGLTDTVSWSIGHYWSYPDNPTPVFAYDNPGDALSSFIEMRFKRQATTGASLTFYTGSQATQSVVRAEAAYVWNEAVFMQDRSLPVGSGTVFIPGVGFVDPGIPVPLPGQIEDVGAFKWVLGLDNNIWIKPLNLRNTFFVSLQAFGHHILRDWSDDISIPMNEYPSGAFVKAKKNEYTFTAVINTKYLNGNLTPDIAMAYDPSGVWYLQPSLKYRWGNWEPMIRYSYVSGHFYNLGFFRDRDQISVRLTYYFN